MKLSGYYFLVLDIETSTMTEYNVDKRKDEPSAVWLSYGYMNLYDRYGECCERKLFREWKELADYMDIIQQRFPNHKLLCYVHNLAYEFDFLIKNISKPVTFLTNSSHGVISAVLEGFPGIEFRCSFKLSMQSLKKIGEMVGLKKLEDSYTNILPGEDIPKKRLQYCCRDCDIVAKYIVDIILKEFGTFHNIPLTKTGRVRKTFQKFYDEERKNKGCYPGWDLMPDEDCFEAMENAFAGGLVICNPMFAGRVLKNVHSYDITSSYPYVMLKEKFPLSIQREYNIEKRYLNEPFWIAKMKFKNIHSKFVWGWLSVSKMDSFDELTSEFFNGKLLHSSEIIRTITNIDFENIKKTYYFDDFEIIEFYHMYCYDYIPYPYWKTIEVYGVKKGEMKEIVEGIDESSPNYLEIMTDYMLSKNDFNSIFGMSVQKLVQTEYDINDFFDWIAKDRKYVKKNKHIKRNFLIGVYITAYARRNLINAIIKNCPNSLVYSDTDSIKFIGKDTFIDTNEPLQEPFISNQYLKKLGKFVKEHSQERNKPTYTEFIVWGAKKYSYKNDKSDNVYLTVAGLPKYKGGEEIRFEYKGKNETYIKLDQFKPGMIFKNCKLGKMYIFIDKKAIGENYFEMGEQEKIHQKTLKYLEENNIKTKGGVALFPVDYSLDITRIDKYILLKTQKDLEIWAEKIIGTHWKELIGIRLLTK